MWRRLFPSSDSQNPSPQAQARPTDEPDLTPTYQSWHEFNQDTAQWTPVPNATNTSPPTDLNESGLKFTLATWNIDAFSPLPKDRLTGIFSRMLDHAPAPDIIFLQEVNRPMVPIILNEERIREGWYSSEKDTYNWGGQLFATMVLMSKARFSLLGRSAYGALGRVSRVKFRTRYGRDALCSEIMLPSKPTTNIDRPTYKCVRLVNVHLDSLAITPSRRPHQLSVVSNLLHEVGCGLVAGDFNPVLPEDQALIEENNLVDAWKAVRGEEPGYTWGVDGTEPYPPNRMDKVAVVGLRPLQMEVMHPDTIVVPGAEVRTVLWSDHSGLKCTFEINED